jgi:hypothetical protein
VSDRTYAPDVESTGFARSGLPDDPNLEMEHAASRPAGWVDAVCQGCSAAILIRPGAEPLCTRCAADDEPQPPAAGALFPEVPTWTDEQLLIAIELADRREPGLNLYAVGNLPDRPRRSCTSARRSWCGGWRSGACGSRREDGSGSIGPATWPARLRCVAREAAPLAVGRGCKESAMSKHPKRRGHSADRRAKPVGHALRLAAVTAEDLAGARATFRGLAPERARRLLDR